MKGIGGNINAVLQRRDVQINEYGEHLLNWQYMQTLRGWLDLSGGGAQYGTYNAKIQESTHVFVADYSPLADGLKAENCHMVIGNKEYDVLLIDDPMEMHKQLEFYLRLTGGQ